MVKNLPFNTGDARDAGLGWEDPLEKEMATHSSILACEIPWMEEPGGLQYIGLQRGSLKAKHQCISWIALSFTSQKITTG